MTREHEIFTTSSDSTITDDAWSQVAGQAWSNPQFDSNVGSNYKSADASVLNMLSGFELFMASSATTPEQGKDVDASLKAMSGEKGKAKFPNNLEVTNLGNGQFKLDHKLIDPIVIDTTTMKATMDKRTYSVESDGQGGLKLKNAERGETISIAKDGSISQKFEDEDEVRETVAPGHGEWQKTNVLDKHAAQEIGYYRKLSKGAHKLDCGNEVDFSKGLSIKTADGSQVSLTVDGIKVTKKDGTTATYMPGEGTRTSIPGKTPLRSDNIREHPGQILVNATPHQLELGVRNKDGSVTWVNFKEQTITNYGKRSK